MYFAQFWHNSTGYVEGSIPPQYHPDHVKPIEACGSDSVAILDGRLSLKNKAAAARDICKKRGYLGFTLHAGESFSRSRQIRFFERLK